jgi:hypothetical protein
LLLLLPLLLLVTLKFLNQLQTLRTLPQHQHALTGFQFLPELVCMLRPVELPHQLLLLLPAAQTCIDNRAAQGY